MLLSTKGAYGRVAKYLHWSLGIFVIVTWIIGIYAAEFLPSTSKNIGQWFLVHKSLGMLVLLLVVIKFFWRLYDTPPPTSGKNRLINITAHTVHYLLYLNVFIQALSGWAMSSAAGRLPTFFGLFTFPGLIAKNPNLASTLVQIHDISAFVLLALIILHILGALFHHFILRDDTLKKML